MFLAVPGAVCATRPKFPDPSSLPMPFTEYSGVLVRLNDSARNWSLKSLRDRKVLEEREVQVLDVRVRGWSGFRCFPVCSGQA